MNIFIKQRLIIVKKGGSSKRVWYTNLVRLALLFTAVLSVIFSCSSKIPLKPTVVCPSDIEKIKIPLGFFNDLKLRSYQHSADIIGNKNMLVFCRTLSNQVPTGYMMDKCHFSVRRS